MIKHDFKYFWQEISVSSISPQCNVNRAMPGQNTDNGMCARQTSNVTDYTMLHDVLKIIKLMPSEVKTWGIIVTVAYIIRAQWYANWMKETSGLVLGNAENLRLKIGLSGEECLGNKKCFFATKCIFCGPSQNNNVL